MPLIVFSPSSTHSNYTIVTPVAVTLPYYNIGTVLNVHDINSTNFTTDLDVMSTCNILLIYQTNLTLISNNEPITAAISNNVTNSTYNITLVINNTLTTTPTSMYSPIITDSTITVHDNTLMTIYDTQIQPASLWVTNNMQQISYTSSIISLG
jgi:hypothetical protein